MSSSGRQLLGVQSSSDDPSRGDDSSNQGSSQKLNPASRPKRTLIESACAACRRRKSKCDGLRPTCTRCQALRSDCVYEAEEGESRWSALRRRSQALEQERDDLRDVLSWLVARPEQEALEAFHRIRSTGYEELLAIARQAREGSSGVMPQGVPSSAEQRLPPIRALVEIPGAGQGQSRPGLPSSIPSEGSVGSYSSSYSALDHPPPPPNT